MGHQTRSRENDDSPLWQGQAVKQKPPFFNARALIARAIMRSRERNATLGMTLIQGEAQ